MPKFRRRGKKKKKKFRKIIRTKNRSVERCRSRNAIRRTYRNVPDRPYGQTQRTYANRVRERAGFNMRDSTAGSAARLAYIRVKTEKIARIQND